MMADFPFWQQGVRRSYPALEGPLRVDAAIVGGGLAGITAALFLQEQGLRTAVLEADVLGHGASFGCGGLAACHGVPGYRQAAETLGIEAAKTYAQLMRESALGVAQLSQRLRIPCGLTETSVYAYAETRDDLPALHALVALEGRLGLTLAIAEDAGGCPFPVELSAVMRRQWLLQPLPYLLGMAEHAAHLGCQIFEGTRVLERTGTTLRTAGGSVRADTVILCTGVPVDCRSQQVLALMEPRLREARVLSAVPPLHTAQLSVHADEMSLRPLPGGCLMTFDRGAFGTREEQVSGVIRDRSLRALLPEARTEDIILRREMFSRDGLPLIGPVRPGDSRVLMAGGFGGFGLPGAFLAARILTGLTLGQALPESALFRPFRSYPGKRRVVLRGLRASGRAQLRRLTSPSAPRCPHMGCPLRYNPGSRRWECPCHGSAFDVLGQVEAAPAAHDAQLSPRDRP